MQINFCRYIIKNEQRRSIQHRATCSVLNWMPLFIEFSSKKEGNDMKYSQHEVIQFVQEEDIKFIRLIFCDVFGKQKNIAIMPEELPRAFKYGIAIDASGITGFGDEYRSDLLLHPDPDTLMLLPWKAGHLLPLPVNLGSVINEPILYGRNNILPVPGPGT